MVIAGHNDPNIGIFVCNCRWACAELVKTYNDKWNIASPQTIAQRIANDHNERIKLRREVAILEKRMEEKRTVLTDIEELFGG